MQTLELQNGLVIIILLSIATTLVSTGQGITGFVVADTNIQDTKEWHEPAPFHIAVVSLLCLAVFLLILLIMAQVILH